MLTKYTSRMVIDLRVTFKRYWQKMEKHEGKGLVGVGFNMIWREGYVLNVNIIIKDQAFVQVILFI